MTPVPEPRIALLVLSCDRYSGLWEPNFRELRKQWPDCPFDIYLTTNRMVPSFSGVTVIPTGEDGSWAGGVLAAVRLLKEKYQYILVTLDDLLLSGRVESDRVIEVVEGWIKVGGNYLQLIRSPHRVRAVNEYFGEIPAGMLYRPTCVWAVWKPEILEMLLVDGESAWEFERKGAQRSARFEKFYSTNEDLIPYRNTVVRGRIVRKDARRFGLENLEGLPVMTLGENISFLARYYRMVLAMKLVPERYQKRLAAWKR